MLSLDSSFWAIYIVTFYGMFHKALLLPTSSSKFDSSKQLTKVQILGFFPGLPSLSFTGARLFSFVNRWLKSLDLPCIPRSKLCPTATILQAFSFTPPTPNSQAFNLGGSPHLKLAGFYFNLINFSANSGIILLS